MRDGLIKSGRLLWGMNCYAVAHGPNGEKDFRTGFVYTIQPDGELTMVLDGTGFTMHFWPSGSQISGWGKYHLCSQEYYEKESKRDT